MTQSTHRNRPGAQPPATRITRRKAFEIAALICATPGALLLTSERARAQQKAPKDAVRYQPTPMNDQQCSGCLHFMPGADSSGPGSCAVVAGEIAPQGWCTLFAPKP